MLSLLERWRVRRALAVALVMAVTAGWWARLRPQGQVSGELVGGAVIARKRHQRVADAEPINPPPAAGPCRT